MKMLFNCDRTCHAYDECKFSELFRELGRAYVTSHTVTVDVQFKDQEAFGRAAVALGGKVIGQGNHSMYPHPEEGFAVTLPDLYGYFVLKANGKLAYDGDHGTQPLETLKAAYAREIARAVCERECWQYEEQPDGSLLVYHPSGGTMTVSSSGEIEAAGFTGTLCDQATAPLAEALGEVTSKRLKPSYHLAQATQQQR